MKIYTPTACSTYSFHDKFSTEEEEDDDNDNNNEALVI
jgi:hypothetical protein